MKNIKNYDCLNIMLGDIEATAFMMDVSSLLEIQYIARRGTSNEPGAVQRVLNPIRVNAIYEYVMLGNIFYTPFILNWTNEGNKIAVQNNKITIDIEANSAQVLDGQHRIAGLDKAIKTKPEIGEKKILVIMTQHLSTENAAKVFLNINTEQKPVQKSLIYDLFGIVNKDDVEMPLVRAKDIAVRLNENEDSPYSGYIKFPGNKRGTIGIELSAVVNSLSSLVGSEGFLSRYNINSLEKQSSIFQNYFSAIKSYYEEENLWDNSRINPFLTSAGFYGAIEAFKLVFQKCLSVKDFSKDSFRSNMRITSLLQRSDLKSLDGKEQRKVVNDFLQNAIIASDIQTEDGYKF